jgi:biopolymer transport protein TolQ
LEVVQRDPHYADSDVEKRQEILTHQLNKSLVLETFSLERGLSFLSIVSSTAVFVGLFGTVWGIMHGFKAISAAQSTSLGVVAPAIAEALFATALGLIAAIPANVAFNRFTYFIHRYQSRLELFVQDIVLFLRRQ